MNGEVWAIGALPTADEEFKLVVRVTGSGELSAVAVGPDGTPQDPLSVERHTGSNFSRPGDEWGIWFDFDQPGCWEIVVERGDLTGVITLGVKPEV